MLLVMYVLSLFGTELFHNKNIDHENEIYLMYELCSLGNFQEF